MSQSLAILALGCKVAEYLAKQNALGPSIDQKWIDGLAFVSIALLFVSVILWLRSTAEGLAKVEGIEEDFKQLRSELGQTDLAARYGSAGASVASLIGIQPGSTIRVHCEAGGLTFRPLLLEEIPRAIRDFQSLSRGDSKELRLRDQHIVDNFLLHLIRQLPAGSYWFGVSRLQSPEAWQKKTSAVPYHEFQEIVQRRTGRQEIAYYRLLALEDSEHYEKMKSILREQQRAKLNVRYTTDGSSLDDVSVIWVPKDPRPFDNLTPDASAAMQLVENRVQVYEPLCAVRFATRGGRELEEMTIYSPGTEHFKRICIDFKSAWIQSHVVSPE